MKIISIQYLINSKHYEYFNEHYTNLDVRLIILSHFVNPSIYHVNFC